MNISQVELFALVFGLYCVLWFGHIWFNFQIARWVNAQRLDLLTPNEKVRYYFSLVVTFFAAIASLMVAFWATMILGIMLHSIVSLVSKSYRQRIGCAFYGAPDNTNIMGLPRDYGAVCEFYHDAFMHATRKSK